MARLGGISKKRRESTKMFLVTPYSNMVGYKRRPELYARFAEMIRSSGYDLITVELAFGQHPFEVTETRNPFHLQLRSYDEFFHKENITNLGIAYGRQIFPNADKVCWIDGDCRPVILPKDWLDQTWSALERWRFVQMWDRLQPLTYDNQPLGSPNPSFMSNYIKFGTPYPKNEKGYPTQWGSPGLAWAADLASLDAIGGLADVAILGAGDWYLAHMLISDLDIPDMANHNYSPGYRHYWETRQRLCNRYIKNDVGFVQTLMVHDFHGKTVDRGYNTRENILIWNQYDPYTDLKRGHNGVYQLETYEPRQIKMYEQIRAYFKARNEDSIDHV